MEGQSFFRLKGILSSSSSPKKSILLRSKSSPSPRRQGANTKPHDHIDYVANRFVEDATTPLSSSLNSSLDPLCNSLSSSYMFDLSVQSDESSEKYFMDGKKEISTNDVRQNRHAVFGKPTKRGGRSFPPPISYLKLFKVGKPYAYLNFNEEHGSFVLEEIRIPGKMFHASNEDGSLKLYFAHNNP